MTSQYSNPPQNLVTEINESKTRNKWLHMYFPSLDPSQVCVADFSCALHQDYLRQGRLYLTTEFLCFHSFIGPTKLIVPIAEIKEIIPKSVFMIPTAMMIHTENQKYELTSFIFRDKCIKVLKTIQRSFVRVESDVVKKYKVKKQAGLDPGVILDFKYVLGLGCVVLLYQLMLLYRTTSIAYSSF
jgi:hypothetical protein